MPPLADPLGHWHEFYTLLGAASATLVGLLFVAASVGPGVFSTDRRAPLRVFLSASVVNFSLVLASCLIVLMPLWTEILRGAMLAGVGIFGLAHSCLAWRDTLNDGLIKSIDLEDRVWYFAMPILGYLFVVASGISLALQLTPAVALLAVSVGLLLAVGIHNAWDITVWIITRRRE